MGMNAIIKPELWANEGGLIGLVMLALFLLVVFVVMQLVKMNNRLIDFKATAYQAGILPDRRKTDLPVAIDKRVE
jgi:hypothetical protein